MDLVEVPLPSRRGRTVIDLRRNESPSTKQQQPLSGSRRRSVPNGGILRVAGNDKYVSASFFHCRCWLRICSAASALVSLAHYQIFRAYMQLFKLLNDSQSLLVLCFILYNCILFAHIHACLLAQSALLTLFCVTNMKPSSGSSLGTQPTTFLGWNSANGRCSALSQGK
jgi:hypothetical protein